MKRFILYLGSFIAGFAGCAVYFELLMRRVVRQLGRKF